MQKGKNKDETGNTVYLYKNNIPPIFLLNDFMLGNKHKVIQQSKTSVKSTMK
jgi:hypothetical protein